MTTVRIFFEKCGEAAYISLLDLQRVFHRMLKMSSLPVYYTQGVNPHIYLSFSCPLSLGQESLCESCEVKTEQESIEPQRPCECVPDLPCGQGACLLIVCDEIDCEAILLYSVTL